MSDSKNAGVSEQELAEIEKTVEICGLHGSAVINAQLNFPRLIVAVINAQLNFPRLIAEIRRLRTALDKLQKFKEEVQANKSIWIPRDEYFSMRETLAWYGMVGDNWTEQTNKMFDDVEGIDSGKVYAEVLYNYGQRAREALG